MLRNAVGFDGVVEELFQVAGLIEDRREMRTLVYAMPGTRVVLILMKGGRYVAPFASNRISFWKALRALFAEGNSCQAIIDSSSTDWTEFSGCIAQHMVQRAGALGSSG